jgi:predicted GIY-YIG superfamily endonuclease
VSQPTTLYRFYDAAGRLLYVGIAGNPGRRFNEHSRDKAWWSQVARSSMEHFATREEALWAEEVAIKVEQPAYNVVHNRSPRQLDDEATTGDEIDWMEWTCGDPECIGRGPFYWSTRHGRCRHSTHLTLMPEADCSPCVDDVFGSSGDELEQGHIEVAYWIDYLRRKHHGRVPETVSVYWSVAHDGGAETAPFPNLWGNHHPDLGDFLTWFSWPWDARTGAPVNFLHLPIEHRFPRFVEALGWRPEPLASRCPVSLLADTFAPFKYHPQPVDDL